jgi:L,D-peptidoglycan transpeptidase YkuD (ErfK/YbiS/YcfS/YnhG family)
VLVLTAAILALHGPPVPHRTVGAAEPPVVPAAVLTAAASTREEPVAHRPAVGQVPRTPAAADAPVPGPASQQPAAASADAPPAVQEQPAAAVLPLDVDAGGAGQLVTVVVPGARATTAQLTAWERTSIGWTAVLGPVPARVGSAGVGVASETSTRTPAGTSPLSEAFGRAADPGSGLPYRVVDEQDWWVSDVTSPLYNQHARCAAGSCPFDESVSENLLAAGAVYDSAVVIDHNRGGAPGAGSAFFLHVTNGAPTAGCVAIERGSLRTLLQWLDPGASPLIAIGVG